MSESAWRSRRPPTAGTCDGCSESRLLQYEDVESEAWLCRPCWLDAVEVDILKLALRLACNDGCSDADSAIVHYVMLATGTFTNAVTENAPKGRHPLATSRRFGPNEDCHSGGTEPSR